MRALAGVSFGFAARAGCVAALSLVLATAAAAATATVAASTAEPGEGDSFYVTVSGAGFPDTTSATLGLTWNSKVVEVTGVELVSNSPFTDIVADSPWDLVTLLGPLSGAMPSGSFDAFRVNFKALAEGDANILVIDDGADQSWTDADGNPIAVTYTQAKVTVVTPLPAAAWLLGSALGFLGLARRRAGPPAS